MIRPAWVFACTLLLVSCGKTGDTAAADLRPNIVFIVADDLGYSDLGVFGSEIPTPNIDALARDGMLLTSFYSGMTCSPTRSMYMSGTDNHLAGLGVMLPSEHPLQRDQPGYESYLNFRVVSLADLLRDAGYHTYISGKWHLGTEPETGPLARGFEKSFISFDGGSHLGGLSWGGPGLAPYRDGSEVVTVADDFYSTRFFTERMIDYIEDDRGDGRPFFAYLAYTAPHWPLQAPPESIAKFAAWYDGGYEMLYRSRVDRMKAMGLIPEDMPDVPPVEGQPAWTDLTAEERRTEARKMEIFAAMVSDLDAYVGQFVDYLKSINEFDNTFIMFISDNGPEAGRFDLTLLKDWVDTCCDNSYENLGQGDSYVMYGPNWARAGSAPFRRAKWTGFEGGIHVPAFVHFPGVVPANTRNDGFATVLDIFPTFLELAQTEHPGTHYRGRPVLPVQGTSLAPMLFGETTEIRGEEDFVGWELYGQRAIRQGDWKIVWDSAEGEDAAWYLFNVAEDPSEQRDLKTAEPERLEKMLGLWDAYVRDSNVIVVR